MADKTPDLAPPEKILPALIHHYSLDNPAASVSDTTRLIDLLSKLPALSAEDHLDTLAAQLETHAPGGVFSKDDMAVISFVDEAVTEVLARTDLDFKVESFIRNLAPRVAVLGLTKNIHAITAPNELFDLIDLIIEECIGWSEDLGFLGHQFMEKVSETISGHSSSRLSTAQCIKDLKAVFKKEAPLFKRLEKRLCERELDVLSGKKGEFISAEALNKAMTGNQLPLFIIFMLQGPWYEFLQDVYIHYGGDTSKEWLTVVKLTEAIMWSLQPGKDRTKQSELTQSIPAHIKSFCKKADFDTKLIISALADLEAEYESINAGDPSEGCDFDLLATDDSMAAVLQEASSKTVDQIKKIPLDQWFLYDDPAEPDEKVARIKLILNWTETKQLLLTNHNRRKVVHLSYGEMMNHLNSCVLRKLNPIKSATETFRAHLFAVLKAVSKQNKKEKKIEAQQERRAVSKEYSHQRKEDLGKELELLRQQAVKKKNRAMILRHKVQKKYDAAAATVSSLKPDAWVTLSIMEGVQTPCKLVAIIASNQTYIFANRAGLKVAEYSASQLAHMIVTENSEILDTGAEFESALATVVSGLREDKSKSYEELTGDSS